MTYQPIWMVGLVNHLFSFLVNIIIHNFILGEQKFLSEILKRLKEQDWFKQPNEVTVETLTKYLINKLIERDPSNHEIISSFIKEIKAYVNFYYF